MLSRRFAIIIGLCAALSGSAFPAEVSTLGSGPTITAPTSILIRPANTTPYTALDIIASNTAAGSIVVPSFNIATVGGKATIPRIRLSTNVTTGWDGVVLEITLWRVAPTFTGGDNAVYGVATGMASILTKYQLTLEQGGDGAWGEGVSTAAAPVVDPLGSTTYWSIKIATGAPTPTSGQTFTITPDVWN